MFSVVLVADEIKGKSDQALPSSSLSVPRMYWYSGPEVRCKSIVVDQYSQGLISQLESNATIYPLEFLETVESNGVRRIRGILEKQMLEEAGYGQYGNDNDSNYYQAKDTSFCLKLP